MPAHPCSLTLASETQASRETRTFQVRGEKNDFRFPTLATNKPAGEVTKCFLSKETEVSGGKKKIMPITLI